MKNISQLSEKDQSAFTAMVGFLSSDKKHPIEKWAKVYDVTVKRMEKLRPEAERQVEWMKETNFGNHKR